MNVYFIVINCENKMNIRDKRNKIKYTTHLSIIYTTIRNIFRYDSIFKISIKNKFQVHLGAFFKWVNLSTIVNYT